MMKRNRNLGGISAEEAGRRLGAFGKSIASKGGKGGFATGGIIAVPRRDHLPNRAFSAFNRFDAWLTDRFLRLLRKVWP